MRVEGVGVEQVQRVVENRVADLGDLPGGAHGIAEIGRDPGRHVQHQRPGRQHREHDPGDDSHEARPRRARMTAREPSARCGSAIAPAVRRAAASGARARRRLGGRLRGSRRRTRGLGTPVLISAAVRGHAGIAAAYVSHLTARSAAHRPCASDVATHASRARCAIRDRHFRHTARDEGPGDRGRGCRGSVCGDRSAPAGVREGGARGRCAGAASSPSSRALGEPGRFTAERVDASNAGDRRADRRECRPMRCSTHVIPASTSRSSERRSTPR